jgi:hypothetical protein
VRHAETAERRRGSKFAANHVRSIMAECICARFLATVPAAAWLPIPQLYDRSRIITAGGSKAKGSVWGARSVEQRERSVRLVWSFTTSSSQLTMLRCVSTVLGKSQLDYFFTSYDLKRLDCYASNLLDYHVIVDFLPTIAVLYFEKRFGEHVKLSGLQSAILLGIGLQKKTVDDMEVRRQVSARRQISRTCLAKNGVLHGARHNMHFAFLTKVLFCF